MLAHAPFPRQRTDQLHMIAPLLPAAAHAAPPYTGCLRPSLYCTPPLLSAASPLAMVGDRWLQSMVGQLFTRIHAALDMYMYKPGAATPHVCVCGLCTLRKAFWFCCYGACFTLKQAVIIR
ncbi:hypothetical protein BCR44DRAFT_1422523, partial [Catenaria anguillulae PL171]